MKLRIEGESLRIRVSEDEFAAFQRAGRLEDRTGFGPGTALTYCLVRDESVADPRADLDGCAIHIRLPAEACNAWFASDDEAIQGRQAIAGDGHLDIAVEKDFSWFKTKKRERGSASGGGEESL